MTQEEKELLLRDLCARLPYGVHCRVLNLNKTIKEDNDIISGIVGDNIVTLKSDKNECYMYYQVKPYLRSISSMTDEEREEWTNLFNKQLLELEKYSDKDAEEIAPQMFAMSHFSSINWLYSKHFNISLPKEAFIEVTEENNPYK